ncbi:hypothetical protein JVU11DRAFT_11329 [Chiua virens]|nr:hypothetical protein JVU11DRAFT_11329 [Chiua virens]
MVSQAVFSLLPSTAVYDGKYMTPTQGPSSSNLPQNNNFLDSWIEFKPSGASVPIWYPIPNGQLPNGQELHDHSTTHRFLRNPELPSHYPNLPGQQYDTNLPLSDHTPPHLSFTPSAAYWLTHPSLATYINPGFIPSFPTHHRLRQSPASRSRRKRSGRAIEFNGLWIDEEELLQGVTDPDGRITVFQCRLEEDYSPCHLWVQGDKSCVNMHIQKWHGGKPGGEKLAADCHWSGCGETMLKESISRHLVGVHLGELWECQGCRKRIARKDAYMQHSAKSAFVACQNSGAVITYAADAREIDVHVALNSGGALRYAGSA